LQALRPLAVAQRRRRLWCLFGCGGDRDASKRPLMGDVAGARCRPRGAHQRQPAQRGARADPARRSWPASAAQTEVDVVEADRALAIAVRIGAWRAPATWC